MVLVIGSSKHGLSFSLPAALTVGGPSVVRRSVVWCGVALLCLILPLFVVVGRVFRRLSFVDGEGILYISRLLARRLN